MHHPDLARWRAETPGCTERIHLNNAGAALMPAPVLDAMRGHLDLEARIGGYEAADAAADDIGDAYAAIAARVGAASRNIAVVENATVAVAQALSSFDFRPGDRIVTSRADYISNQIMYLSLARRSGVEVVRADDLPEGGIDPESVRQQLRRGGAALVAVSWIPTNSGLVQPVEAVGEVCAEAGVPFLVDACQAVGQLPIDVAALRCDFLAATARKFLRGPRGAGFLYVSDAALAQGRHPLLVDMRGADWTEADRFELRPDARRFENWEFAYALLLGMGAAARYAEEVGEAGFRRARALAARLREELRAVPGLTVLDRGTSLCAIVTIRVGGHDAHAVRDWLRARGVNTTAQERADAVIDMDAKEAPSLLRLSPHYYNTEDEIAAAVELLREFLDSHPPSPAG
jgi:selenocysteine lyase/cysteine desulfurase